MKDSFLIRGEWQDAISALSNEDAGQLLKAIYSYNQDGSVPDDLSPMARVVFLMARSYFDATAVKYRDKCEQNSKNGSRGGRPKKTEDEKTEKSERLFDDEKEKPKKANGFFENPMEYELECDSKYDSEYDLPVGEGDSARACAHTPAREHTSDASVPGNVNLTDAEIEKLKASYPTKWQDLVDHFSVYLKNHPKKRYRCHLDTILDWAKRDGVEDSVPKTYDLDDFFQAALRDSEEGGTVNEFRA